MHRMVSGCGFGSGMLFPAIYLLLGLLGGQKWNWLLYRLQLDLDGLAQRHKAWMDKSYGFHFLNVF